MNPQNCFYNLKELENRAGKFYREIGERISIRFPDIAKLFKKMAEEEDQHASQVDMAKNFFTESSDAFKGNQEELDKIPNYIEFIEETKKFILGNHEKLLGREIVKMAMEMEQELNEGHRDIFYSIEDPQIKQLFKNMYQNDEEHIEKLGEWIAREEQEMEIWKSRQ